MPRRLIATCAVVCLLGSPAPAAIAAKPPQNWDGLNLVKAKRFEFAYLAPGADFRGYRRVMLDPTEVAFQKDWLRNYNAYRAGPPLSETDARAILAAVRTGFEEIFRKAYAEAGYEIVTEPAADVLRLRTAVINLAVAAPDKSVGRAFAFARTAGGATVVLEARDSVSGALLGRAVDGRTAGDTGRYLRDGVSNSADFAALFRTWARSSIEGLAELRARLPTAAPR